MDAARAKGRLTVHWDDMDEEPKSELGAVIIYLVILLAVLKYLPRFLQ